MTPQLTVWINMVSFAAMAGSVGLLYLAHTRTPRPWLVLLMTYTALYGLWVLFSTYTTFQVLFLPEAPPAIGRVLVWVRLGTSFAILGVGSFFYLTFSANSWRTGRLLVPLAGVLAMGAAALVSILLESAVAGILASVVFNGVLGGLSIHAAWSSRSAPDSRSRFTGFLWFTAVVYFVVLGLNVLVPATAIPPVLSVILLTF